MNDILKQRLVGALILVALGVVFWPIIFVEPGERRGAGEVDIPPPPQVDTSPVEPPDMAGLRPSREISRVPAGEEKELLTLAPDGPAVSDTPAPAKSTPKVAPAPEPAKPEPVAKKPPPEPQKKTRTEPPVKPKLDADGLPISWILQVASVSSSSRADELRKDLVQMGHKAYVKKVRSGDKTLYRVYVGPKVEKAQLEKIQGGINSKFGVTTMITRYYP
jgi:DedD protein